MVVWQPERAFRYGSEAFWLVGFALEDGPVGTALDLGTGSGIAALLLARAGAVATGIDARAEWVPGWARSLAESAAHATLEVADVGRYDAPRVDVVVSNPPYFPKGTGPAAPDPWKAAARTEGTASLDGFVAASTRLGRRACFVVPVERGAEVVASAAARGWGVSRWVQVGRRRALIALRPGDERATAERVDEDDPRVAAWVRRARAG